MKYFVHTSRNLRLGDVSEPLLIRGCRQEVAVDGVFTRGADLAQIGAVATSHRSGNGRTLLLHQTPHEFLGDEDWSTRRLRNGESAPLGWEVQTLGIAIIDVERRQTLIVRFRQDDRFKRDRPTAKAAP
ncbi:hypothetical protein LMG27174_02484 [Paraburkholderia rhynchosiae]|uniref:Uncharacterized protein n=1 Tax=Paraburkholderia rhynchosiae TaxID=487049 RepID=A0A6J5AQ32_9BURK|nr:hypothetical protein LMG27174_02484 [Paraburkholderia rhynchosiae]